MQPKHKHVWREQFLYEIGSVFFNNAILNHQVTVNNFWIKENLVFISIGWTDF